MNREQIKTGIVGSGFAASFHFEAIKKVSSVDVKVVGVYSRTKQTESSLLKKEEYRRFRAWKNSATNVMSFMSALRSRSMSLSL